MFENPLNFLWLGAIAFGGWLWFYLFGRQFLFNVMIAFPLIKKMNKDKVLININSKRYTIISCVVCGLLIAAGFLILLVKPLYLKIGFFCGALVCLIMVYSTMKAENKSMFDAFLSSYYRFVEDDELRQAMYEKKYKKMIGRVNDLECDTSFIPSFKKEKKDNED